MDAKIDKGGQLELKRPDGWKKCYCFRMNDPSRCGDWCPAFDDSEYVLRICTGQMYSIQIDERAKNDNS